MNLRWLALLAATAASTIYGINHTIAKGLMPDVIGAYGFIVLRVTGAAALFWLVSLFFPNEKVDKKDWPRFIGCAAFGMVINMLMFFKGLSLSTPINSSVVITLSPVLLLVLSSVFLKERITWIKATGIGIGLAGALILIIFGAKTQPNAPNIPLGNMLFIINAISYSIYLIMVKPLVAKYSSITLMKWFFLFAVFMNLPVGWNEFAVMDWAGLDWNQIWGLSFVVVGTTFMTYLLNVFALKELSPSTIGAFIYLQPVLATGFAILMGADTLNALLIGSAALIFTGVYLSSRKRKTTLNKQ